MEWDWEMIRPGKIQDRSERRDIFLLGLAGLYDSLVMIFTLGLYTTKIRAWLLFDVFTQRDDY